MLPPGTLRADNTVAQLSHSLLQLGDWVSHPGQRWQRIDTGPGLRSCHFIVLFKNSFAFVYSELQRLPFNSGGTGRAKCLSEGHRSEGIS